MKALFSLVLLCALTTNAQASGGSWTMQFAPNEALAPVPPGMGLQKMITLTTDRDADTYLLHLMQDARSLQPTGMFVELKKAQFSAQDDGTQDPVTNPEGKAFLLADIEKPAGVPLFEAQGRKVLLLQGALDRDTSEGRLHLKYLTNGLSMTYDTCDVILRKTGTEFWVQNAYTGSKVTSVKVVTSMFGVVTLDGICAKKL